MLRISAHAQGIGVRTLPSVPQTDGAALRCAVARRSVLRSSPSEVVAATSRLLLGQFAPSSHQRWRVTLPPILWVRTRFERARPANRYSPSPFDFGGPHEVRGAVHV